MDTQIADQGTQYKEMIDRGLSRMNTCIPGVIDFFDADTQTCTAIPAIQMKVSIDGETTYVDLPPVINAPLIFPLASTAGFALTLPVRKGDPCLLLFSQRALDNWHLLGGIQRPEEGVGVRHHDLTDALVMLAASPLPGVLGAWEQDGIELRNRARTSRITVKNDSVETIVAGASLIVHSNGTITATANLAVIDAPLTQVTGDLAVAGGIACAGSFGTSGGKIVTKGDISTTGGNVSAGTITLKTHRHGGITTGGGTSGVAV